MFSESLRLVEFKLDGFGLKYMIVLIFQSIIIDQ
jgi:hypothetical protein